MRSLVALVVVRLPPVLFVVSFYILYLVALYAYGRGSGASVMAAFVMGYILKSNACRLTLKNMWANFLLRLVNGKRKP